MPGMWSELEHIFRQDNVVIGWSLLRVALSCQPLTHFFQINQLPFLLGMQLDVNTLFTRVTFQAPIGNGPSMWEYLSLHQKYV
jgi:hypothetical protein